uniref:Uncharacterized protein n=1 Tax=Cucumis melo TaxID=3656 RepID=A0A9I9EJ30_CUCME
MNNPFMVQPLNRNPSHAIERCSLSSLNSRRRHHHSRPSCPSRARLHCCHSSLSSIVFVLATTVCSPFLRPRSCPALTTTVARPHLSHRLKSSLLVARYVARAPISCHPKGSIVQPTLKAFNNARKDVGCQVTLKIHTESSKKMEIVKVVKSQKCGLLTLKSQTLTGNIFKYDLNLQKINADSCPEGQNWSRWTKL